MIPFLKIDGEELQKREKADGWRLIVPSLHYGWVGGCEIPSLHGLYISSARVSCTSLTYFTPPLDPYAVGSSGMATVHEHDTIRRPLYFSVSLPVCYIRLV